MAQVKGSKGSKENGKAKRERVRLSEKEAEKFIAAFAKKHDLKGAALDKRLRLVAAGRLATLSRYEAKHAQ